MRITPAVIPTSTPTPQTTRANGTSWWEFLSNFFGTGTTVTPRTPQPDRGSLRAAADDEKTGVVPGQQRQSHFLTNEQRRRRRLKPADFKFGRSQIDPSAMNDPNFVPFRGYDPDTPLDALLSVNEDTHAFRAHEPDSPTPTYAERIMLKTFPPVAEYVRSVETAPRAIDEKGVVRLPRSD